MEISSICLALCNIDIMCKSHMHGHIQLIYRAILGEYVGDCFSMPSGVFSNITDIMNGLRIVY